MILEVRTCKSTLSAQLNAILGTRTYRSALSTNRESVSLPGLLAPAAHADVDVRAPGIACCCRITHRVNLSHVHAKLLIHADGQRNSGEISAVL